MQYIVIDKKELLKTKPSLIDKKNNDGTISFIHSTRLGQQGQERLLSCSDAVDSKGDQVATANRSESFKSVVDAQHQLLQTFSPSKIDLNRNIVSPDEVGSKDGNYKDEPSFSGGNSKGLRIVIPQPAKNKHFEQYMQKRAAAFRRHSHFSVHTLAGEKAQASSHPTSTNGNQLGKKTTLGTRANAANNHRESIAA